ncbi:MAG: hypothetical protein D3916_14245 [Candidatus Electrothrix sp. MAN1_4]|nr:hypothetical protein [Candidatus Electrothrix sp. MAN1_4]
MTLISDFLPPADVLYLIAAGLLLLLFMVILFHNRRIEKKRYKKLFDLLDKQVEKERVALERTKGICGDCGSFLSHNAARCKVCGSEQPFDQVQLIELAEYYLQKIYLSEDSISWDTMEYRDCFIEIKDAKNEIFKNGKINFELLIPAALFFGVILLIYGVVFFINSTVANALSILLILVIFSVIGLFPNKVYWDLFLSRRKFLEKPNKYIDILRRIKFVFVDETADVSLVEVIKKYDSIYKKTENIYKSKSLERILQLASLILIVEAGVIFYLSFQIIGIRSFLSNFPGSLIVFFLLFVLFFGILNSIRVTWYMLLSYYYDLSKFHNRLSWLFTDYLER